MFTIDAELIISRQYSLKICVIIVTVSTLPALTQILSWNAIPPDLPLYRKAVCNQNAGPVGINGEQLST